jgi:site-specific DNA-methyltransferase (adenine-specific)
MPEPYYQDSAVTIYHGDCRDVLPSIGKVDLVLTDPPYSSGARTDSERQIRGAMLRETADEDWFTHDTMTTWGFTWFIRGIFSELRQHLEGGSHLYLFCDWRQTPNLYGMLESCGYRVNHCLVWAKTHYGMGAYWRNQHENIVFASLGQPAAMLDRGMGSVIVAKGVSPSARQHPTEKPSELLETILRAVPCTTIIDPFMGSGPTVAAAKKLGKNAIGIEIDEHYCEIAANRCRQMVMAYA